MPNLDASRTGRPPGLEVDDHRCPVRRLATGRRATRDPRPSFGLGAGVLDVGCGCGVPVARALAAARHQITGVDLSPVQVERAMGLVPGARFLCADVTTLSLPHESFHIPLPAQPDVLAAMAEWLVDDGLLLLTAGASAWTGSEVGWLGGDADMWWSHADAATYRGWLADSCLGVISEDFVPEGTSGHSLFWARRQSRVR